MQFPSQTKDFAGFAGLEFVREAMAETTLPAFAIGGSALALAQTIVDRWPSGRGHYLLGTELLTAGRRAEGMAELRASAVGYPGARYAIGTELLAEGQMGAAIDELALLRGRALQGQLNRVVNAENANLRRAVSAAGLPRPRGGVVLRGFEPVPSRRRRVDASES